MVRLEPRVTQILPTLAPHNTWPGLAAHLMRKTLPGGAEQDCQGNELSTNTSLAAPGALAHLLQRLEHLTSWNTSPPAKSNPNGRRGLQRDPTIGFWSF